MPDGSDISERCTRFGVCTPMNEKKTLLSRLLCVFFTVVVEIVKNNHSIKLTNLCDFQLLSDKQTRDLSRL
jgi:hypothetical protein